MKMFSSADFINRSRGHMIFCQHKMGSLVCVPQRRVFEEGVCRSVSHQIGQRTGS
jgi:hypothetical protein